MQHLILSQHTDRLTIKKKIFVSSALLAMIIAVSNFYSYYSNRQVLAHQRLNDQRLQERLQVLLQLETISKYVALAELESRSYILFEKEEFNQLRTGIWKNKITPAANILHDKLAAHQIQANEDAIGKLLNDLSTFQRMHVQTENDARALFEGTQGEDSTDPAKSKTALGEEVNQRQRPVFDAIKEGTALLIQQQRDLIQFDSQALTTRLHDHQLIILVVVAVSLVLAFMICYHLIKATISPLRKVGKYLSEVALGNLPLPMNAPANEIGEMITSLNGLVAQLKVSADFASQIGGGKYDNHFTPASPEDTLGKALLEMRENLQRNAHAEQQRNWAASGLAQFTEILRNQHDLLLLGDAIISHMVKYTRSNQGVLFVINDEVEEEAHLELLSCYAWEKKKFGKKKIQKGEGLSGQCWQEGDPIFLTDVPENYIRITSGLGNASPNCIFIVPMKANDTIYGILELASFNPFAAHEREFILKVAENIASALATVRITDHTRRLLKQSQQQAEAGRAQEEELRQNLEELSATQEQMQRMFAEVQGKERYLGNLLDASKDAILTLNYNYSVIHYNQAAKALYAAAGVVLEENMNLMKAVAAEGRAAFKQTLDKVLSGEVIEVSYETADSHRMVHYIPIRNANEEVIAVAQFSKDVTEITKAKQEIERLKLSQVQMENLHT